MLTSLVVITFEQKMMRIPVFEAVVSVWYEQKGHGMPLGKHSLVVLNL